MKSVFVLLAVLVALPAACSKKAATAAGDKPAAAAPAASGRLEIAVTENGFEPGHVKVKAGQAVTLAFTRKTDKTCATEVVFQPGDGTTVKKELPLDQTVEIPVTFPKAGEIKYACGMDMVSGIVSVE